MFVLILIVIIYALLASAHFAFMYQSLPHIYEVRNTYLYGDEGDRLFCSVATSIVWPVTAWFTVPYILIGIKDYEKKNTDKREGDRCGHD